MADHIPFHIQIEIMKRLPVKALVRFRCVAKAWRSLIDSCDFIAEHIFHPQHLLVTFKGQKHVSFVDDDTFPNKSYVPLLPRSLNKHSYIVGSSHGLLCFRAIVREENMTVIWNPSIRKSIVYMALNTSKANHEIVIGFGVSPVTYEPMIVAIIQFHTWPENFGFSDVWVVEVCTLTFRSRRSLSTNLPSKSIRVKCPQVIIDRFIYWCAERLTIDNELRTIYNVIMSFDMTNDNFKVVDLPESLAQHPPTKLSISKLRESLAILEYNIITGVYDVWMMEHGDQISFAKVFNIKAPHGSIMGFMKSGGPLMEVTDDNAFELIVYKPYSEHFADLEFSRTSDMLSVNSYVETLLLFSRCDTSDY